jgi:hypothetical protein
MRMCQLYGAAGVKRMTRRVADGTSRQIESGSVFEPIQAWEGPNF